MSRIVFHFFGPAVFLVVFFTASTAVYSQLDPTFACTGPSGTRPGICSIYYAVSIFNNSVKGIRAFRRSDNSIQFLVHNAGASGKTPPINSMSVLIIPPDAGSYTRTQGPNNIVALDAAMRPDGNMAAVGNMGAADIFIERFAGTTHNGSATLNFGQNVDRAANIVTQPDGKIIVTGISTNGGNNLTVLARMNPDGTFDTTFGPYGNGTLDIYDDAVLSADIDLRPDGKILLAGTYPDGGETVSVFYLLNPDGSPDITFGNGGIAYAFDPGSVAISDVKFQPDGKAVILANRRYGPDGTVNIEEQDVVLRRLNQDGSLDTGFGTGGVVIANTSPPTLPVSSFDPSGFENARELVIENSGNIVVVLLSNQVAANRISTNNDRVDRKPVVYLSRYGPSGLLLGKNVSKQLRSSDIYTPIQSNPTIRGAFEQPGKGIIVHGTETLSLPMAFLARFSSISAPNNANNFFDFNFDGGAEFGAYTPGTTGYSQWRLD